MAYVNGVSTEFLCHALFCFMMSFIAFLFAVLPVASPFEDCQSQFIYGAVKRHVDVDINMMV